MSNKFFRVRHWPKLNLTSARLRHQSVKIRRFAQNYSLPLIATVYLLLLTVVGLSMRSSDHIAIATILRSLDSKGTGYSRLLSNDKTSGLTVDNDTGSSTSTPKGSSTGTSSSFSVNTNTRSELSSGNVGPPAFAAVIASFDQGAVTLQCSKPKPKAQWCSKQYVFSSSVSARNGPGTVNYGWRSTVSAATENGNIPVGGGDVVTTLPKTIILPCTAPTTFTLQFVIMSPGFTQSDVKTINHDCNGI